MTYSTSSISLFNFSFYSLKVKCYFNPYLFIKKFIVLLNYILGIVLIIFNARLEIYFLTDMLCILSFKAALTFTLDLRYDMMGLGM